MNHVTQRNVCYTSLNENVEGNNKISSKDLAVGVTFLVQTVTGVTANLFLFHNFIFHIARLRPTDVILKQLCIANSLVLLATGIPITLAAFGFKYFISDLGCKCLLCIGRVGRGVSIGTVCMLSVFQNIIISPTDSCWKEYKGKVRNFIDFSICFCWIINIVVNLTIPLYDQYSFVKGYDRIIKKKVYIGLCCLVDHEVVVRTLYLALIVFPEIFVSLLIVWSAGSMIFILYRHKQQVQHIHITNVSLRSPESRATQSILFLVSTFVSFYTVSTIFRTSIAVAYNLNSLLVSVSDLLSTCFPTISPFLIMSQDSSLFTQSFACTRNT